MVTQLIKAAAILLISKHMILSVQAANNTPTHTKTDPTKESIKMAKNEQDTYLYKLIDKMTLEEKVRQLQGVWEARREMESSTGEFIPEIAEKFLQKGIGHVARPAENKQPLSQNKDLRTTLAFINDMQKWLINETRLGIPAIFHGEALHGHMAEDATSFPQAIAMASTWNPDLIGNVFSAVALEMRARGVNQALSPVLDVAKDARWGRIEETFGEDPYLTASMGIKAVEGLQGEADKIGRHKVLATLKHLAGHGYPSGGQNIAPAMMGERYLREQLLPPFEQVIRRYDVASVMASYNEIDGVPSHVNKWLLNDVLRQEWGFEGTVVSDYFAIDELVSRHGTAATQADAAEQTFKAGVDIELPNPTTFHALINAVNTKRITEADLNRAVYRVLKDKYRLGLFDEALLESAQTRSDDLNHIGSDAHRSLNLKAAEEAAVLLKNNKRLPLNANDYKRIALIGPHVDEVVLGGYSDIPANTVTLADAMTSILDNKVDLIIEPGMVLTEHQSTGYEKSKQAKSYSKERWNVDKIDLVSDESNAKPIARAVSKAKNSDIIIAVLGDNEGTSREGWAENHLGDRSQLTLPGSQLLLLEKLIDTGKPIVVILQNGRPAQLEPWIEQVDAVIEAWYLGDQTGLALANILLGKVNPSGKLPVSFPRNSGQIPIYYNHKPTAKRGFAFEDNTPMFAFGHGLSYTTFEYSDLAIKKQKLGAGDTLEFSLSVKNTGNLKGKEVIQFYINDPVASITRPVKELKGFYKLELEAGEAKTVHVTMPVSALHFWDADMKRRVESGEIKIMIGSASNDIRLTDSISILETKTFSNDLHLPFFSHWSM